MENKTWIFTLAVVLALGGGGYGACAAVTDGGVGEALTAEVPTDPSIVIPGQEDPLYLPDAGAGLAVEVPEFEVDVPQDPVVEFEEELETPLQRLFYRLGELELAVEDFRTNPRPRVAAPHVDTDSGTFADEVAAFRILARC